MQTIEVLKQALSSLDPTQQQQLLVAGSAVAVGGLLTCYYWVYQGTKAKRIPIGDGWWGAGEKPQSEDEKVFPFQVQTSDEEIQDLYDRIDRTRYTEPLEDAGFQYGFNSTYLKKVVSHWRHQFNWKKQITILNKYPQFKTNIEGLDVHFIHVRPPHREGQRVLPLMLVHGLSLGNARCVKGLHLNMLTSKLRGFGVLFSILIGRYVPWLVGFTREDVRRLFGSVGFMERNIYEIIRETGYLHIQGTKPDSAGENVTALFYLIFHLAF
ncbi:epoxide hydrolase 1 [Salvelinus sp. IW2-2015]|uniref:epoxide hydrolase 1 n=1 Tax=Salvelinus sp. IW2-2015 TaxID=2691554 RepID=UPI0038D4CC4C